MRVMCINKDGWQNATGKIVGPVYGEELPVKDEEIDDGYHGYYFAKYPWPYLASEFIPLSDIDETEIVREYQTEKV